MAITVNGEKAREVKYLAETYTKNQMGALTCYTAGIMWGLTAQSVAWMMGFARLHFMAINIIAWIIFPLYIMRIRWGYIAGIVIGVIAMVALLAVPGTPWYTFPVPGRPFNFTYVVYYLFNIAGIYFAYKSYIELKK